MADRANRREFLTQTTLAGAAGSFLLGAAPAAARTARPPASERVRFASIGVGGKGESDTSDAGTLGELVAICDINEESLDQMSEKFPTAKRYYDYRTMLEEMGDKIDAVTVSTPDHHHAVASIMAMNMGKHCFCQKPLTWSVEEARKMRTLAAEKRLATQMGNQGTAAHGFREGVEVIRSGAIGPVKEIHVWTNRPIWPQGISRPTSTPGIPNKFRWFEFLGPAHDWPYHPDYQPFNWRGWLDFGTGALGDMACHTINVAALALELFDPEKIEVVDTSGIVDNASYPVWSIIRTTFGRRGDRRPLTMTWYDGGNELPESKRAFNAVLAPHDLKVPESGLLVVGEKGMFFSPNDDGTEHTLLPREQFKEYKKPEPTLPRSPGHFKEFVDAIQSSEPARAMSNFDYAGRLTETVLLGVVALRAGKTIEWDAEGLRARNCPEADQYIRRDYRKGYSIHS